MKPTFHLKLEPQEPRMPSMLRHRAGKSTAASRSRKRALAIALNAWRLSAKNCKNQVEVEDLKGKLQNQTRHLQRENEELGRRRRSVEAEVRSEFAERIAEQEKEIAELVREVQSERSMGKPSNYKSVSKRMHQIK